MKTHKKTATNKASKLPFIILTLLATGALSLTNCGGGSNNSSTANNVTTPNTTTPSDTLTEVEDKTVYTDVKLTVKNISGVAVTGAKVTLNAISGSKEIASGITDGNGVYTFEKIDAHKIYSINLQHSDYALQLFNYDLPFKSNTLNSFDVVMMPIGEKVNFDATLGGVVPLNNSRGVKITLPANAFIDSAGNPVNGNIEAQVTTIDMGSDTEKAAYPGSFNAIGPNNEEVSLYSFGVVHIDFFQNGQELQLAPGQKAALELPVFVTTNQSEPIKAGDIIPLWWLNEKTGVWVYEGTSTVVASATSPTNWIAQGDVSHFTPWNLDATNPTNQVSISFAAEDATGGFEGVTIGGSTINSLAKQCMSIKSVNSEFLPADSHMGTSAHGVNFIGGHGMVCGPGAPLGTTPQEVAFDPWRLNYEPFHRGGTIDGVFCHAVALQKDNVSSDLTNLPQFETWDPLNLDSRIFVRCYPGVDPFTKKIHANFAFSKDANDVWVLTHTYTLTNRTPALVP